MDDILIPFRDYGLGGTQTIRISGPGNELSYSITSDQHERGVTLSADDWRTLAGLVEVLATAEARVARKR